VELELLKAAARERLAAGQDELDLGLDTTAPGGPLPITASRMGCLLDALEHAYRVLEEAGAAMVSYQAVLRLPGFARKAFRQGLSAACAAHTGQGLASLVLYDVSTLYPETDEGDGFPRAWVLQGGADHDRAARRRRRLPADGQRVRGLSYCFFPLARLCSAHRHWPLLIAVTPPSACGLM
jgi:hypothetical protein